jgi:2-keto-4-pentenoate hydratase
MHRSLKFLAVPQTTVAAYVDYLLKVDKELPSLNDIFPKSNAIEDVVKFHSSLCEAMEKNAFPLVGIKVLPPSCEAVVTLRGTRAVCVPVFSNMFQREGTSVKKDRLQYVDAAICMELEGRLDECDTADSAAKNVVSFSPGIEVNGSRFPFYAPTVTAMACDLAGCVNISKGKSISMGKDEKANIASHRFVLTHNQEPVQVGAGRQCMDAPFSAVVAAAEYVKAMKAPRDRSLYVFCSGVCSRTPVQAGTYAFEWGRWGRLSYSVLP